MNEYFWKTKLLARIHGLSEIALDSFRDPSGHEGGTVAELRNLLFPNWTIDRNIEKTIKWADWWAAGADRPQFPQKYRHDSWVRWTKNPILIHPLNGENFDLRTLGNTDINEIKSRSLSRFKELIQEQNGQIDYRRTYLAYWRFGSELNEDEDNEKLGTLWQQLPADSRIPDHTIWDHLDLTSAFAGAFCLDQKDGPALLILTIGPVQPFIAAARSMSDLWAGSHLLSYLSWFAMQSVCDEFGPDSIIFPRLRGIPLVDSWLQNQCDLPKNYLPEAELRSQAARSRDNNPLFRAALPNRFVAIVPYSEAKRIATEIKKRLRRRMLNIGNEVTEELFQIAGIKLNDDAYAKNQIEKQLEGFPEVNWTVVPFSLVKVNDKKRQTQLDTSNLQRAIAPFFGSSDAQACGFLADPAWQILQDSKIWDDGVKFYDPNPGVLYPAIYDLAERVLSAIKNTREFKQKRQFGWRCSLTGETEWITSEQEHLKKYYRNNNDTLWVKIAKKRPALAKEGEHLGALPAIKRLWGDVFDREISGDSEAETMRFVVSTHTMALARQLKDWMDWQLDEGFNQFKKDYGRRIQKLDPTPVALPRGLMQRRFWQEEELVRYAKQIPALLDFADEDGDSYEERENLVKKILNYDGNQNFQIEKYYSLLLMDGDLMGRILSGSKESNCAITYSDSFHPQIRKDFDDENRYQDLRQYLGTKRSISPNRHMAISAALNDFALHVVPEIIEKNFLGRVIYAGGDDVLAMLPVSDLLPAMKQLRFAYSGVSNGDEFCSTDMSSNRGFVEIKQGKKVRLMRMMGGNATASCGAVVAHHQAPLSVIMRELKKAEQRAKEQGGRDAYSITVVKRSGGTLELTRKWDTLDLLLDTRATISEEGIMSRSAIYNSFAWINHLPPKPEENMLSKLLLQQFLSSSEDNVLSELPDLTERIAKFVCQDKEPVKLLRNFLSIAEFLARGTR